MGRPVSSSVQSGGGTPAPRGIPAGIFKFMRQVRFLGGLVFTFELTVDIMAKKDPLLSFEDAFPLKSRK